MSNVDLFDSKLSGLVNKERQAEYGHPLDHFQISAVIKDAIKGCSDPVLRHSLEMIADKMARLCHSPEHLDSWIDIAGYARTAVMVMDERKHRAIAEPLAALRRHAIPVHDSHPRKET